MDVCAGGGLGVVKGVAFLFAGDLVKGSFLRMVIFERMRRSDSVTGGGAMTCF